MASVERLHQPGSICGKAECRLFRFLRRRSLSLGVELVHALLAAFLRAAGYGHGDVLAAGQARPMAIPHPQRRPTLWSSVENRRSYLSAGICRLRRPDFVRNRSIEFSV